MVSAKVCFAAAKRRSSAPRHARQYLVCMVDEKTCSELAAWPTQQEPAACAHASESGHVRNHTFRNGKYRFVGGGGG